MTDILSIINSGNGNIRLEVTGEDLLHFSNQLIRKTKEEMVTVAKNSRTETYLTKEEVKQLCGVCDTTLWHWNKRDYLKPVKIGSKLRYRLSDIKKLLGEQSH